MISHLCFDLGAPWPSSVFYSDEPGIWIQDNSSFIRNSRLIRKAVIDGMRPMIPRSGCVSVRIPMSEEGFEEIFSRFGPYCQNTVQKRGLLMFSPSPLLPPPFSEISFVMEVSKMTSTKTFEILTESKRRGKPFVIATGSMAALKAKEKKLKSKFEVAAGLSLVVHYNQVIKLNLVVLNKEQQQYLEDEIGHFTSRKEKNKTTPSYFIAGKDGKDPLFQVKFNSLKGVLSIKYSYEYQPV